MSRINKQDELRIQDLSDYIHCLSQDIVEYESGKVERMKTILCSLRAIVCDNRKEKGLALVVADILNKKPAITFGGMKGIPDTNPLSKDRTVTLENYLSLPEHGLIINGRRFSNKEFVWEYSSQDGAHSDSAVDEFIVEGKQLLILGSPAIDRQVISIAKNTRASILDCVHS